MTSYLDTSVLVAATTPEAKTAAIQQWLAARSPDELAISQWTITEYSSALSIKLREKSIDAGHRGSAMALFAGLCTNSLTILSVSAMHYQTAARFADQHTLGLRAGDALHLAVAADHGATLITLDKRQSNAGPALGVRTTLL